MTAPDPDFQQTAMLVFLAGLGGLTVIVAGLSTIWKNIVLSRAVKNPVRTPPIEEEVAKTYALKDELNSFRCEWLSACRANHDRVDSMFRTNSDRVDKTFGEIFSVLRAQQGEIISKLNEVGEWQRGIERQIGHLEGSVEKQ